MEKILKILIVFALLMFLIVYSVRTREKKFREYFFHRQLGLPLSGDPDEDFLSAAAAQEDEISAIDREHQRVFLPGEGKELLVEAMDTGNRLAVLALEERPDSLAFDPATGLIFSYSREGLVTIIRQSEGTQGLQYKIVQRLHTPKEGHRVVNDPDTGRIFLGVGESVFVYGDYPTA